MWRTIECHIELHNYLILNVRFNIAMAKALKPKQHKRIKELPAGMRPMEKFFSVGGHNLSTPELLALLLGTGNAQHNVISLAENIYKQYPIKALATAPLDKLINIPGIGKMKLARIGAAIELGRRLFDKPQLDTVVIKESRDAVTQLNEIANKQQEYLVALYLNARQEVIAKETLGVGSLNTAVIEVKEILKPALITPCAAVILAHNHPSGDPSPSSADIAFTKRVHEAAELLGIVLFDHLIISRTRFFSFQHNAIMS